eukprot:759550-Hanusia_phi.AAC.5
MSLTPWFAKTIYILYLIGSAMDMLRFGLNMLEQAILSRLLCSRKCSGRRGGRVPSARGMLLIFVAIMLRQCQGKTGLRGYGHTRTSQDAVSENRAIDFSCPSRFRCDSITFCAYLQSRVVYFLRTGDD